MAKMKWYDWSAFVLLVVAAINWGLQGLSYFFSYNLNLIKLFTFGIPALENFVYILVGLVGCYGIYTGIKLALR